MRLLFLLLFLFIGVESYSQPSTPFCGFWLKLPNADEMPYHNLISTNNKSYGYIERSKTNQEGVVVASDYFLCQITPARITQINNGKKGEIITSTEIIADTINQTSVVFENPFYLSQTDIEVRFYVIITPSSEFFHTQKQLFDKKNKNKAHIMIIEFVLKMKGNTWRYIWQKDKLFKPHQIPINYQDGFYRVILQPEVLESDIFKISPKYKKL